MFACVVVCVVVCAVCMCVLYVCVVCVVVCAVCMCVLYVCVVYKKPTLMMCWLVGVLFGYGCLGM